MKNLVIMLFIAVITFTGNANNLNITTKVNDSEIPKEVQKWLDKELANTTTKVLEDFESPEFYTSKTAKVIGYIKGYDKTVGAKTGIFYYDNQLTRENNPRVIEIHSDGRFELELPLAYPTQDCFVINKQVISFYLEPGQNLSVILNWEDIKQSNRISYPLKNVVYQGALSNINRDLLYYKPDYSHGDFQKKEATMQPAPFKKDVLEFKDLHLNKINAYLQSGDIDKKTGELLKNEIILAAYYFLFDYYSFGYYGSGQRKENKINDTVPNDYYDFIKDLPLHKQSLLVSSQFSSFINRLEYADPLKYKEKTIRTYGFSQENFIKFLERKNIKVSKAEKETAEIFLKNKEKTSPDILKKIGEFNTKHQSYFKEYLNLEKEKSQDQAKQSFKKTWHIRDSLASNLGVKNNLIYEIIKSRTLKFIMESSIYTDKAWYWSQLKNDIKSPHLKTLGDDLYKRELNKPEHYKLPENDKGAQIFKKLMAPYKGKIVIVQFWNPYSYYKRENLKRIKERRNYYKNNNDIVFLNIANRNRTSKKKHDESVKENGFTNAIGISQDDYNYLRQLFKFNTSVHDVLVDKDGETVYNDSFEAHNIESFLISKFNITAEK
ncbi:hypothetical protein PK35_04735 [Tamlana nanhaiensis]|uniref:Thioredoxin domain-containing protein n=1 Tax=Neotamlana nanhaiensis TaxID=1382798 RepID=A0A0D7W5R6_9FLAO|nr:hypothetical protein [Tamlana nanhaiensis]KJD34043.1 hypothetical protein PK35_04735 [Tamlana nanhaiensis]